MLRAAITALAVSLAMPASAAPECAQTPQVFQFLSDKHHEEPIAQGLNPNGDVIIWWGNQDGGSWTITMTRGEATCIVASGESFIRSSLKPNL